MRLLNIVLINAIFFSVDVVSGSYSGNITKIQSEAIGDAYNTLYINVDISDSPCSDTNIKDRFTIVNTVQHSTELAALMASKRVTIQSNGVCRNDIEELNFIMIRAIE
ncbi:hypothetical protein [Photobacterium rosenbergii]|uniref:Uncharacterized protein n=1 Tax=Photobacterium rosenbergii TaxID=294936 RepID=A0ABU3ZE11_9GAMM|nr:hypothetical protein [Photobacterium rosenbergii]MDV5168333.1 hypothetical protein [Photobacterium rosenbergii]